MNQFTEISRFLIIVLSGSAVIAMLFAIIDDIRSGDDDE